MKWLAAGLTFVNVTTICGCLEGIAAHGLNKTVALSSAIAGFVAALLAFWGTTDSAIVEEVEELPPEPTPETVPVTSEAEVNPDAAEAVEEPAMTSDPVAEEVDLPGMVSSEAAPANVSEDVIESNEANAAAEAADSTDTISSSTGSTTVLEP